MAVQLSTHERMARMYAHRDADRVPIIESPWGSTIERWQSEGMPRDVDWVDYFQLDPAPSIFVDNSPQYPVQLLERTDEYTVTTSSFGVTMKNWRHAGGVPQFVGFTVIDPDSWAQAKLRMAPNRDRINWAYLQCEYPRWREQGAWISGHLWFGFDVTHSWMVGTERVLIALIENPEWVTDMINTMLDLDLALFDMVWDAGYTFDEIRWSDDMGYKQAQFFGLRVYREVVKPAHRKAAAWAHAKGIRVALHSCGDVNPFIPDLIDAGIEMLNPLEVKAGMNPLGLKQRYGQQLAFHGGLSAVLYTDPPALWEEMRRVIPAMKTNGGYVISSDHSVPDSVSLEEFREFVSLAKELNSYD